jgi:hypothetical protein
VSYPLAVTKNTISHMTFTMNTKTITKIVLGVFGAGILAAIALTKIQADCLPLVGKIVSGAAALAILAMAAFDHGRTKRLN